MSLLKGLHEFLHPAEDLSPAEARRYVEKEGLQAERVWRASRDALEEARQKVAASRAAVRANGLTKTGKRKTVWFTREEAEALRTVAFKRRRKESEIVREAVAEYLGVRKRGKEGGEAGSRSRKRLRDAVLVILSRGAELRTAPQIGAQLESVAGRKYSRQGLHYALRKMVEEGTLRCEEAPAGSRSKRVRPRWVYGLRNADQQGASNHKG